MSATTRSILFLPAVLLLVAGCGRVEPVPVVTPSPIPATSAPPSAALVPTATTLPTPTPTAMTTEAPTLMPSTELLAGADVKTFGGPASDIAYSILLTADGGALIVGLANSAQPHGHGTLQSNARLIKTDLEGDTVWEKDYGGEVSAAFYSMIQATRGEYVLLGDKGSPKAGGNTDLYLVQVDEEGNEIWSHTYGSADTELGRSVRQTAEG